jgi:two-component system, NarL family, sensor histidine kinase DevS
VEKRLQALVDAGIALTSELSLDAVLQKLVETAAELTGARYAALGVIDRERRGLERFLTTGIDPDTQTAIGELPKGRGLLGALIDDAQPLRLHDIADDPRSVGFPPNHPPMKSFLGVPVVLRGYAYGNLYLSEKTDGEDFSQGDQDVVTLLASQAAVAIENARLYESATRWLRQLESLIEVGNALSMELDLNRLLDLVVRRLRELVGARLVLIALPKPDGTLRVEAAEGEGAEEILGVRLNVRTSKLGRVLERRRSERVDSMIDDVEVDQDSARRINAMTGLYVPLIARGRAIGVVAVHDKVGHDARFSEEDLRLVETFGNRAATAADLSERVERDALRRAMDAQELERRRLARELHDETGQALTSLLLGLRAVEEADDDERRERLAAVRELAVATLQDVRRLAVELRPKALDDFGLVPALERLVATFTEQTGIRVDLEETLGKSRLPPETETALYRITQEALTNVVKHAHATSVSIVLTRKDGSVTAVIEDDGRGFDPGNTREGGYGLLGMRERVELIGGRLDVEANGAGTAVVAEVPVVR